jgi:hypothetical protein
MQERPRAGKVKRDAGMRAIGNLLDISWFAVTGVSAAPVSFARIYTNQRPCTRFSGTSLVSVLPTSPSGYFVLQ